jgi:hypothetical protein
MAGKQQVSGREPSFGHPHAEAYWVRSEVGITAVFDELEDALVVGLRFSHAS